MKLNRTLPLVDAQRFSMVPRADVPRSTFQTQHTHKSTFNVDDLVPIYCDEVLPGDVHHGDVTFFARLATPLYPIMDNICIETFFFFVPCRLLWTNWRKFMGEQANPTDSIDYTIPTITSGSGGFAALSIYDYFGVPVGNWLAGKALTINALPFRAYHLIWNEWFRDENLQQSKTINGGSDGPDAPTAYSLAKRNKKHDYFTSALPWPVKGGVEVGLPLQGTAPVVPTGNGSVPKFKQSAGGDTTTERFMVPNGTTVLTVNMSGTSGGLAAGIGYQWADPGLEADLSGAVGASLNAMRLAVTTQQLLERDARGGTRYTELLRSHFGVTPEDSRLQRPEYIGGGKSYVKTQAIPQTSASAYGGQGSTPLGALGATIVASDGHPFRYMAKEHGYIVGLVNVSGDITYQQGLGRMWTRATRYDFYWPAFANLGEQVVRNDEIYVMGNVGDAEPFGYQERWAEYRHRPSKITGNFRGDVAGSIDEWHLSELFATQPALNDTFIKQNTPIARVLAAGATASGVQVLWDSVFNIRSTRCMPVHSVPGLTRF